MKTFIRGYCYMTYNKGKFILTIIMIFMVYNNCESQAVEMYRELYNFLHQHQIVAINPWELEHESFVCIIVQGMEKEKDITRPLRRLLILKKSETTLIPEFEFGTDDGFITIYLLNDHLVTLWGTGSALRVRVFSVVNQNVQMTLEQGTRLSPEIADIDHDGYDELFITNGHFLLSTGENRIIQYPETTDIYKWNGTSFQVLRTVPWKKRFTSQGSE